MNSRLDRKFPRLPLPATLGLLLLSLLTVASHAVAQQSRSEVQGDPQDAADEDYSAELPRIPPTTPEEAREKLHVHDGFRVELVASEPLVVDPIAFAFDAQERLYVVEMRGYSEQPEEHLGRIALLTDSDSDGVYDQRKTFVDGLSWPTAVWPWGDGALVAEPPTITWYRDTDGDGVSDQSEVWFDGFERSNVQGMVNSLRWGVDGRLHGATSSVGGTIENRVRQDSGAHQLGRRDFAIDPRTKTLEPESGGGQHGLSFNRWGDKFVTSNSDHLQQIIDLEEWLVGRSTVVPLPRLRRSIAADGPQAEVFRVSPVEPWRIVRTRLRVSGITPGIVEGGGRPAGYFTGATGTWIVDHDLGFGDRATDTQSSTSQTPAPSDPANPPDIALVCDVGSNLVHRKRLIDRGLHFTGQRIDPRTEFIRSEDIWFRPVQLGDGPDGAIYIADMAREVIEHPKSLPPMIKKHLDLTSGRDRGRIWRVTPIESDIEKNRESLHDTPNEALVGALSSRIPWRRRMASQLLIERAEATSLDPLRRVALRSEHPEARLLALHVISRLDAFDAELAGQVLGDPHPRVQQHAVELSRINGLAEQVIHQLRECAQHAEPRVQLALAKAAAELPIEDRLELLEPLLSQADRPLVQAVIATSAESESWRLFAKAFSGITRGAVSETKRPRSHALTSRRAAANWLSLFLPMWLERLDVASEEETNPLQDWLMKQFALENDGLALWLDALCAVDASDGLRLLERLEASQRDALLAEIERALAALDVDLPGTSDPQTRVHRDALRELVAFAKQSPPSAARWARLLPSEQLVMAAEQCLTPAHEGRVQLAMVESLAWARPEDWPDVILGVFDQLTPAVQRSALRAMTEREASTRRLADALASAELRRAHVPPELQQRLMNVRDAELANHFGELFEQVSEDRAQVIVEYTRILQSEWHARAGETDRRKMTDEVRNGRKIFSKACAQCHRLGDVGQDVGPPLKQLGEKSPDQLLAAILDPNREVDPKYTSYNVLLDDGRVLSGIIADEAAGQLTLIEAGGKEHQVRRVEIEQLSSSGMSLMPVGLEQQVDLEQMVDLIRFLKSQSE